ncbi:MAG: zf-HC2 domain-containing protein [candidate division WOR-3 bacterium]|nr:MAG: zf-HC2 domain-containing protein [candidate division WOR-3 bacterium]
MKCIDVQENIIYLLCDEISPDDRAAVLEHIRDCPACREEYKLVDQCLQLCTPTETENCACKFQETYWEEFVFSVHEKIIHEKFEKKFPFRIVLPVVASAVVAFGIGYFLFIRPKPQVTAQERAPQSPGGQYEEVYELTPEQQEEFIKIINQRYGQ